jgi:TetR/AcrR family transcriptional regulator, transcriptional repressor for nem operon
MTTPRRRRGRPRSFDETAVVDASVDVFWRRGYAQASVSEISAATGLSASSIYNAFGSKADLFVAALDRYLDVVMGGMLGPLEHGTQGLADVDAFLERLASTTELTPPRGCLAVNTIGELRDAPDAVAQRTTRYRNLLHRSLRAALTRAADAGDIPAGAIATRSDALASIVVAFNLLVAAGTPARETHNLLRAARALAAGD